jgi:putative transposase
MKLRQAIKYRLYPTKSQETLLREILGTCCDVYNSFLHWRRYDYDLFGTSPSYYEQKKALPRWKKDHPELGEVHSQDLHDPKAIREMVCNDLL